MPDEITPPPGAAEAARVRACYETAIKGLRAFVEMGFVLMDVKARLPHGRYIPWCDEHLGGLCRRHLHRAKSVAEGLAGAFLPNGTQCVTFENLPSEALAIIDGASKQGGIRALLAGVHLFKCDKDEDAAKAKCEELFGKHPELRDEWEPKVVGGTMTWGIALRGMSGQVATKGGNRAAPDYEILIPSALKTLGNGFRKWSDLEASRRVEIIQDFKALLREVPAELRTELGLPSAGKGGLP